MADIELEEGFGEDSKNVNFNKIENYITVPQWGDLEDNSAFGYVMGCLFCICGIWCVFCVREKNTYLKAWFVSAGVMTSLCCIFLIIIPLINEIFSQT